MTAHPTTDDLRQAHRFLGTLRVGDRVTVQLSEPKVMVVSRPLTLQDFAYGTSGRLEPAGAWDSAGVMVTFGPGRYSTRISVHSQAIQSPGMPYVLAPADDSD